MDQADNMLISALHFMKSAHEGQVDKAGLPYYEHPLRVLQRLLILDPEASEDCQVAALLHDVLEDCDITTDDLISNGFSEQSISIILELTRDRSDGKSYQEWVSDIANTGSYEAILIKLADNLDNSDPERLKLLDEKKRNALYTRYIKARNQLTEGLSRFTTPKNDLLST